MANTNMHDWKDVALSYLDKSFSLSILFFLFVVMVSPKLNIKPYEVQAVGVITVDLPPEVRDKLKPPEDIPKPVFDVVIDDNLSGKDTGSDLREVDSIDPTKLDINSKMSGVREVGKTPKFVAYEDPPVPVKKFTPEYTQFARRANIQGTVWLDVEILVDGQIGAVLVKKTLDSSPNGLDEAAIAAVKKWKFQPARSGGKPVACWAAIPVVFSLSGN